MADNMSLFGGGALVDIAPASMEGPNVGAREAFGLAYSATEKTEMPFAPAVDIRSRYERQRQLIKERIGEDLYEPFSVGSFNAILTDVTGVGDGADNPAVAQDYEALKAADARINELKQLYPDQGFENFSDMWGVVKQEGRAADRARAPAGDRLTAAGFVGDILGSAAAYVSSPARDPLSFATMFIGGVGKTAPKVLATEFGFNGVVEGINQFTGVAPTRERFELEHNALMNTIAAATGATVLRGAFIGTGKAFEKGMSKAREAKLRKSFGDLMDDEAARPLIDAGYPVEKADDLRDFLTTLRKDPALGEAFASVGRAERTMDEINPFGDTASGRALMRAMADKEFRKVMTKWADENIVDGAPPPKVDGEAVKPYRPTYEEQLDAYTTALADAARKEIDDEIAAVAAKLNLADAVDAKVLDEARKSDVGLFSRIDEIDARRDILRRELEAVRKLEADAAVSKAETEVARLRDAATAAKNARQAKKFTKQADDLEKEIGAKRSEMLSRDAGPEAQAKREQLMALDEQKRDLAVPMTEALSKAREKLGVEVTDRKTLQKQLDELNKTRNNVDNLVRKAEVPFVPEFAPTRAVADPQDVTPTKGTRVASGVPNFQGKTPREAAKDQMKLADAVVEDEPYMDDVLDSFLSSYDADAKTMRSGVMDDLDEDMRFIVDEEGTSQSLKELRQEIEDTNAAIEAMKGCAQ